MMRDLRDLLVAVGLTARTIAASVALDAASALISVAGRLRPAGSPRLRLVRDGDDTDADQQAAP